MAGGGPLGEDIPGEQQVGTYRGGELRLTDRRVVYRGRGWRRHESMSVHLEDVTAVGIGRRVGLNLYMAAIPGTFLAIGLFFTLMTGWDDPFFIGLLWAMFSAPVMFVAPVYAIRIATPGHRLGVRVPRRLLDEAKDFIQHIEVARSELREQRPARTEIAPTAVSFA